MSKLEDVAEVVRLTIKAALAPAEAQHASLDRALTEARTEVALLRERLAIVEARLADRAAPAPAVPAPEPDEVVTLQ
jgi:hypothetical protein